VCVRVEVFVVVVDVCYCCFSKLEVEGRVTKEHFQLLSCQVMLIGGDAGPV